MPFGSSAAVSPLTSDPLRARAVAGFENVPLDALPRRMTRIEPPGPSQATSAPFGVPVAAMSPFVGGLPEDAVAPRAGAVVEQAQLGAAGSRPGDEAGLARPDGGS